MRLYARDWPRWNLFALVGLLWAPAPLWAQEVPVPEPAPQPEVEVEIDPHDILDRQTFMTAAPKGSLTVQLENDVFGGGTDRHYTNGMRISYVFPAHKLPPLARFLRSITPFIDRHAEMRVMGAVGQNIFTPSDILDTALIAGDRPYAGWLYAEIGLSVLDGRVRDSAVLSLGVVGPASLAKDTQRWWHGVIGVEKPEGWANQLRNEPAVLFLFEREWLTRRPLIEDKLYVDFSPRAGFALGNVFDYVAAGGMIRLGPNLPRDFGVPRIRPSLPGSGLFAPPDHGFDWYLFAGGEVRFVARNIFLDGNTFASSHSVDKKPFVFDAQIGAALTLNLSGAPLRLSYALVFRSKEFKAQTQANVFGSISASVQF